MMLITIHSNLPHIVLQFGPDLGAPNCPSTRCAVDTCATLSTGNFHLFTAVAKRYPHCLAMFLVPANYAPIVLSGIVQTNNKAVTTKLEVGFQYHPSYCTLGGYSLSLLMVTGSHVLVYTIVGLLFIKATGMILDFVDGVVECKHLDCPPFPINYRLMSNHVPVTDVLNMPVHNVGPHKESVLKELHNLERWMEAKVLDGSSSMQNTAVHFGSKSPGGAYTPDMGGISTATSPNSNDDASWVPPTSVPPDDYSDDYHQQILREDGYL